MALFGATSCNTDQTGRGCDFRLRREVGRDGSTPQSTSGRASAGSVDRHRGEDYVGEAASAGVTKFASACGRHRSTQDPDRRSGGQADRHGLATLPYSSTLNVTVAHGSAAIDVRILGSVAASTIWPLEPEQLALVVEAMVSRACVKKTEWRFCPGCTGAMV
jgi:hypothetical protein